jgi:hypothetical protein
MTITRPARPAPNLKQGVASKVSALYRLGVAANSVTGFCRPTNNRRTSVHVPKTDAFFVPEFSRYGGCTWDTFGCAGFLLSRSANPRTAATLIRFAAKRGSSSTIGASPMQSLRTQNPTATSSKAAAHRTMAMAALRANSSLSVRLTRYNAHMSIVRSLEAGGVQ